MADNQEQDKRFASLDHTAMPGDLINYIRRELRSETINYLEPLTQITGGYETQIFRFRLSGLPEEQSGPLVLRVYPEHSDEYQPDREEAVQNIMAELGYPVPVVHGTCKDKSVLGHYFLIMDYVEGETLMESGLSDDQLGNALGDLHAKMHNIDPEPIMQAMVERGWPIESLGFDGRFEYTRTLVNENFPWLNKVAEWLGENRPKDPEVVRVCHSDFHPLNILYGDRKVQAVLDWAGFVFGDPAMDVAITSWVCSFPLQSVYPDADALRIGEAYHRAYRKIRPLDETSLAYYRVFRNLKGLIEGAQGNTVLNRPETVESMLEETFEATGIKVEMPW